MRIASRRALFFALMVLIILPVAFASNRIEDDQDVVGGSAGDSMFNEAPMLAALVAAGELPPVDERLPDDPVVAETVEGIGTYGGQLRVFNNDLVPRGMWGSPLLRVPNDAIGQLPNIAADYEIVDDGFGMVLYLRPGMKWSDGEPFTSEDIRFQYEDIHFYESEDGARLPAWGRGQGVNAVEVIDEYTIKLIRPAGIGTLPMSNATWFGTQTHAYEAAHYLKQWHITYNEDAPALAEEEGFENWIQCFRHHFFWADPKDFDQPKMTPWFPVERSTTTELHERNAFYWKVDAAGQQLPYIDSVIVQIVDSEVYQLKITSGDADIAWQETNIENLQLYMQSQEVGGYRVDLHPGTSGGMIKFDIARTHADPVLNEIYSDVRFRQAVSVAVDREDINDTIYNGLGVERQYAPLPTNSYYKEEWGNYYAQYDPDLANRLLDEVGLDEYDGDGFRMRPDGQTLSVIIEYQTPGYSPFMELIKEYWEAVGLKTTLKLSDVGLVEERMFANELFAYVHGNPGIPWADERGGFQNYWTWTGGNSYAWNYWLQDLQAHLDEDLAEGETLPFEWRLTEVPESVSAGFRGYRPDQDYLEFLVTGEYWQQTEMGSPEYIDEAAH